MSRAPKADVLIARWKREQDIMIDPPHEVIWANGNPAQLKDYLDHMTDTHAWIPGSEGVELYMLPHIVADVRYDPIAGRWMMDGVGLTCVPLDIADADAPDDEIVAELYTRLVVYKARIHR